MIRSRLFQLATLGILAAGAVLAQSQGQSSQPGAKRAEFLATYLGLTDDQKAQAKTIFENARTAAQALAPQLKDNRQAIQNAAKTGADDATLQGLTNSQGVLMGKLAFIRAKAFGAFYAILTPDQKDKADKLQGQLMGMLGARFPHLGL